MIEIVKFDNFSLLGLFWSLDECLSMFTKLLKG